MKMKLKNLFSLIGLLFQLQPLQSIFFFVFLFFFNMETLRAENGIVFDLNSVVNEDQVDQCAQKWVDRNFFETCEDGRPVPADVYQVLKKNLKNIKKRALLNHKKDCRMTQISDYSYRKVDRFLSRHDSWKNLTKKEKQITKDNLRLSLYRKRMKIEPEYEKEKRKIRVILKNAVLKRVLVKDETADKYYIPCHENVKRNKRIK